MNHLFVLAQDWASKPRQLSVLSLVTDPTVAGQGDFQPSRPAKRCGSATIADNIAIDPVFEASKNSSQLDDLKFPGTEKHVSTKSFSIHTAITADPQYLNARLY